MIRSVLFELPGVMELVGRGVYSALPDELPGAFVDSPVIITGDPMASAAAALRMGRHGCSVTLVLCTGVRHAGIAREVRTQLRSLSNVNTRFGMELIWAVGIDRLEAIMMRHIASGRIDVCNADALFVLVSDSELTTPGVGCRV